MAFKGKLIPPKLTTVDRDAITSPKEGEQIYNLTNDCLEFWDGVAWQKLFASGTLIDPSAIGGGAFSEVMSFASGGEKHVSSTSPTYESLAHIIFGGTDAVGDISKININTWVDGVSTADVRVVDLSTGLVIVELTGINSQLESNIRDMGAISNLPTTPSTFEIQGRKTTGGGSVKLYIAAIQSLY